MDDNKAKSFGVNPFDDDANAAKAKHFSDDEGSDAGEVAKKKERKQRVSRVVDEDLIEDQEEVKHKAKKQIKGYKSDVKEYVSKVSAKGQRSELKDSLAEEGAFADKDVSVKKKRKRKRRKKVSVSEKVKEKKVAKVAKMPSVGAVSASDSSTFVENVSPEAEEVVPGEQLEPENEIPGELIEEAMPVEEQKFEENVSPVPEPEEVVSDENPFVAEEPVVEENIAPEIEESAPLIEPVAAESVVPEEGIFNPFESNMADEPVKSEPVVPEIVTPQPMSDVNPFANSEEKNEEVKPINPFANSSQNNFDQPKWRNFSEDKENEEEEFVSDDFNNAHEEVSSEVIEPEIVESRSLPEEPKAESVEPKTVSKESSTPQDTVSDLHDRDGFLFMLEQAGITKGKIIGVGIGFVVVILLIISAFFIPFGSIFGGGTSDNTAKNQQTEQPKKTEKQPTTNTTIPAVQSGTEALNMSEILGNEYGALVLGTDKTSGAFFALSLGGEFVSSEHRFSYYMRQLNELQNLYATDVYKLLDQSYDRRATLTDFLEKMKMAIETGKQIQSEVAKAASNLNSAYLSTSSQEVNFQTEFFTDVKDLRGQDSFTNLEKYIGFSQNAIRLRSYYKAYNYISDMYVNSLKKIEPRYQDILVNFDALVKGVHVFDVTGSDINAIIRLSK